MREWYDTDWYAIERLRANPVCFEDFKDDLPEDFREHVADLDTFLKYFNSRELCKSFILDDSSVRGLNDEEIYDRFKSDTVSLRAHAYTEQDDIGIALFGMYTLSEYDPKEKCYKKSSFGDFDYFRITNWYAGQ